MRWKKDATAVAVVLGIVFVAACGSSASDAAGFDGTLASGDAGTSGPSQSGSGVSEDAGPEQKAESSYQSPVATGKYVWVANPTSGRVAYIDATTLEVHTVEAGNGPTYLAPLVNPAVDSAIVLNVVSNDATLLKANGSNVTATNFKVAPGANTWATSKDGRWAIAWTNALALKNPDPVDGFQDLSVVDVTGVVAPVVLSVGYRPVSVGFTGNSQEAYAVTQDGISIIDLTGASPILKKNVAISTDPLDDPGTRDVSVTPDGSLAFVRRDGQPDITVVSLADGTLVTVTLPGNVTDLRLSAAGDEALAVVRDSSTVGILPVPGIFTDPLTFQTVSITDDTVGSVVLSQAGDTGLLYTSALPVDDMTVLSISASPTYRTLKLYSPVLAVFPTPDASYAVVLHDKLPAGSSHPGAFSIVPVSQNLPARIVGTEAPPTAVAMAPGNTRGIVAERDDTTEVYGAYITKMPELTYDRYTLASPPIAVGIVAGANRAYVAQEHPEGRITFIDLVGGEARTLTGFELAARIVDGSNGGK